MDTQTTALTALLTSLVMLSAPTQKAELKTEVMFHIAKIKDSTTQTLASLEEFHERSKIVDDESEE